MLRTKRLKATAQPSQPGGPSLPGSPPGASGSWRRTLKGLGKRGLRTVLEQGQRLGVSILPRHFYSEVPDLRALRASSRWRRSRSMSNVSGIEIQDQLEFVRCCCRRLDRAEGLRDRDIHARACLDNGGAGYGPIESEFLHAFIRETRPPQVIQVGCGVSTAVMLRAAAEAGHEMDLICVDPFPSAFLRDAADEGRIRLIASPAQELESKFFEGLAEGGLLFVDSSHVVGPGSEVNLLILEVLPRLRPGHWIHFHDIYFPYDYQRGLLGDELFFSNESALLMALLIGNPRLSIRASLSMLHYDCPDELRELFPDYRPARSHDGLSASEGHFPSSIYLQVVDDSTA